MNRFCAILLPFILRTLIVKILGEEYLGINGLFASILDVLNFAELGLGSAIAANMYKPIAEEDKETICALLNFYRKWYRVIGLSIIGLGISILPFLHYFIKGEAPEGVNIYILFVIYISSSSFSYLFWAYKSTLISAHQRMNIVEMVGALCKIITVGLQIIAIVVFKDIMLYALANLLCIVLNNIFLKHISDRDYPNYVCKGVLSDDIKAKIKKNVVALLFQKIGLTISSSIGTILISTYLGLRMVAIYGNYYMILGAVGAFVALIYGGITASVGNSIATETIDKNYRDFIQLSVFNCWIVGWSSICLLCLYQPFMEIWLGESMMLGYNDVFLFSLCFFSIFTRRVVMTYKDAAGMWYADKYKPLVGCIINMFLGGWLVSIVGIKGILSALIVSNLFVEFPWETYVLFKFYFKKTKTDYYMFLLKMTLSLFFVGALSFYLTKSHSYHGFIGLFINVAFSIFIPNMLLYVIMRNSRELDYFKILLIKLKSVKK